MAELALVIKRAIEAAALSGKQVSYHKEHLNHLSRFFSFFGLNRDHIGVFTLFFFRRMNPTHLYYDAVTVMKNDGHQFDA